MQPELSGRPLVCMWNFMTRQANDHGALHPSVTATVTLKVTCSPSWHHMKKERPRDVYIGFSANKKTLRNCSKSILF